MDKILKIALVIAFFSTITCMEHGELTRKPVPEKQISHKVTPIVEEEIVVDEIDAEISAHAAEMVSRMRWDQACSLLSEMKSLSRENYFMWGYCLFMNNDFQRAASLFRHLAADSTFILRWDSAMFLARSLVEIDSIDNALEILSSEVPEQFSRDFALRRFDILKDANRFDEALAALDDFNKRFSSYYSSASLAAIQAEIYLEKGDKNKAIEFFKKAFRSGSTSRAYNAAIQLDKLSALDGLDLYRAGKAANSRKTYSKSSDYFARYLATGAKSHRGEAEYLKARAAARRGRYSSAIEQYRTIIANKSYHASWAYLGAAWCYRKLGNYDRAQKNLELAIEKSDGGNSLAESYWEGIELARDRDDYGSAGEYAYKLSRKFPSHELGDNGAVWAGLGPFIEGDYRLAAQRFEFIDKQYSDRTFVETGEFLRGLSLIMDRDSSGYEVLREISQSPVRHYYRYLAGEILSGKKLPNPLESKSKTWLTYDMALTEAQFILAEKGYKPVILGLESNHAKRAQLFARMGMIVQSQDQFRAWVNQIDMNPERRLALLELAFKWNITGEAYQLALGLVRDMGGYAEAPPEIIRLAYPTFYAEQAREAARESNIDPALIFAILRRESAFKPHVVSYAGAIGLCQIMPATGEAIAAERSEKALFDEMSLYDWQLSIFYGSHYLAGLLQNHLLPEYALGEYNAGPGPVARWKKTPHETSRAIFVEGVDYAQTRHYIRKVMSDYYAYKELWDESI